jgi:phosphate transport system protein
MSATKKHYVKAFDEELEKIRSSVNRMAQIADMQLLNVMEALRRMDHELAESVIDADDGVDYIEYSVENLCVELLARMQPLAGDLRLITTTLKILTDLDRISDYSVDIALRIRQLTTLLPEPVLNRLSEMATLAREMLKAAVQAYVSGALDGLGDEITKREERVDDLFHEFVSQPLLGFGEETVSHLYVVSAVLISKYLERIADHSVNIASRVYYAVEGRRVNLNVRTRPELVRA